MQLDNITIIISIITVLISIVFNIMSVIKEKKFSQRKVIDEVYEYHKLKNQIRNINSSESSNETGMIKDDIMKYMKII